VLQTDEEIGERGALGIQSLISHHRDLIAAEYALNKGGELVTLPDRRKEVVVINLATAAPTYDCYGSITAAK